MKNSRGGGGLNNLKLSQVADEIREITSDKWLYIKNEFENIGSSYNAIQVNIRNAQDLKIIWQSERYIAPEEIVKIDIEKLKLENITYQLSFQMSRNLGGYTTSFTYSKFSFPGRNNMFDFYHSDSYTYRRTIASSSDKSNAIELSMVKQS